MHNVYNLAMFLVLNCNLLWYMEANEPNKVEDGDQSQINYLTQVYLLVKWYHLKDSFSWTGLVMGC